ncbi:uncharacterized protein K452DRAFT_296651 [Aplosporella prunicola CBS 121167]|uniref:Tuberous sclerosis 1 protein n=1 Tax=Aplosporella prunicola CBS 121167 TaxID=1176127 RepID=A0A6A6BHM9_9PEZI|nr:uncharacterized protein K452DRAFT_296651 [Aplosporella prunicola CBS 121167]KAF2143650.1 hypothetical protein K452DRAFT_296651 [Aplosporella prunicola CBS 121167]
MASAVWKDASKALDDAFASPTAPVPLPEELQQAIDAFLEKIHELDEADAQRLHEDLLACYHAHIHDHSEKHGAFLKLLNQLRPAIRGHVRLTEWWDLVLRPIIDGVGYKREEVEDAREFVLSVLAYEPGEEDEQEKAMSAAVFLKKLLDCYLWRTRIPSGDNDTITPEDEFVSHEVELVLVAFGRGKPKELLSALNELFVQAKCRAQAVSLLSTFVRVQPPHLYSVLETPLIQNLEKCMMIDDSGTVVELALTVLIMFLPHITGSLVPHLPKLFLIYSRVLCWEQVTGDAAEELQGLGEEAAEDEDSDNEAGDKTGDDWEKLAHAFDHPETSAPGALYYFTFLYGLFPINFMTYVRKPIKWLKSVNYLGADDIILDQDAIRRRTEPFRQVHLLHPNFFNMTAEDELSETRFLKSDPADVVTGCMSLCMNVSASLEDPGPPPNAKLPDIPEPFVATEDIPATTLDDDATAVNSAASPTDIKSASLRNTQSTVLNSPSKEPVNLLRNPSQPAILSSNIGGSPAVRPSDDTTDSPTLPGQAAPLEVEKAPFQRRLTLRKDSDASTGFNILASPRLEAFANAMSSNQISSSPTHVRLTQNLATLQREVMLLRNDLNFERYLKNQHLSHIGQLQRRHIKESRVEAETQNLINTNRNLKAKLQKANELYAQLKKETMTGRNQSKKWEGELSTKLKSFRDESKTWHTEEESLRTGLHKARSDNERLRRLVVESEARELNSNQNVQTIQVEMEEMDHLRQEIDTLQARIREFELKELEFQQAKENQELLRNELKLANMKLDSRDADRERTSRAHERKYAELATHQSSSSHAATNTTQLNPAVQQIIDSALAATNSRFNQLKKTHGRLLHRFTELEMHCQALEGDLAYARGRSQGNGHSEASHSPIDESSSGSFVRGSSAFTGSITSGRVSSLATRGLQHSRAFSDNVRHDDEFLEDDYLDYHSPSSSLPPRNIFSARPECSESLPSRGIRTEPASPAEVSISPIEAFPAPRFHAFDPLQPSNRSTLSVDTSGSGHSRGDRQKSQSKPDMRIYGRGGAQNTGKKNNGRSGSSDRRDPPRSGSGGFRGFKGLMFQN